MARKLIDWNGNCLLAMVTFKMTAIESRPLKRIKFEEPPPPAPIGQGAYAKIFKKAVAELPFSEPLVDVLLESANWEFVAIKVLLADKEAERDRLPHEAEVSKRVRHPHLGFYAFDKDRLITPFFDGGSLTDKINEKFQDFRCIMKWMKQTALGLQALHSAWIYHRDVKPDNVMLNRGQAKLIDFGLSVICDAGTYRCQEATILGTPAYLAPEVVARMEHSAKSDVWGLAATFLCCLDLKDYPYENVEGSNRTILLQIAKGAIPRTPFQGREGDSAFWQRVQTIFDGCFIVEPDDRFSIKKVLDHLNVLTIN